MHSFVREKDLSIFRTIENSGIQERMHVPMHRLHVALDPPRDFAMLSGPAQSSTQALLSGLHAQSALTRGASAWALGNSNEPDVIDPLIQASYDTDARVRQWAVRSLVRWDASRVADALISRLGDSDAEVRQWAVRGLSGIRDIRITESLIPMLQDGNAEVREWAVRALGYCDNQRAVGALDALRDDPNRDVREWVERSLEAIDCR